MIELGIVGLTAMVLLVGLLAKRSMTRSTETAGAFVAAVVMALYSLVEPISLVVTPLLFLFLSMSGPISDDTIGARWRSRAADPLTRIAVGITLVAALLVSLQMLSASTLERWGRTYGEAWALDDALRVQPWRLSAAQRLALRLAIDGRAGDAEAADRARTVIGDAVVRHPWDVDVRLWAADVETLLRDDDAAAAWIDEHLERFPSDAEGIRQADREALENP